MSIKPYHLKLTKLSKRECEVSEAISKLIPRGSILKKITSSASDQLSKIINSRVDIEMISWREKSYGSFIDTIPITMLSVVINISPIPRPMMVLVEKPFALMLIDASLGGDGVDFSSRPLSDTEQGILEYIFTKILNSIKQTTKDELVFNMYLENITDDHKSMRSYSSTNDSIIEVTNKIVWEGKESLFKLILPDPILSLIYSKNTSISEMTKEEQEEVKLQIKRYGYINIPVSAEVGKVQVGAIELSNLEEGDVVILDESSVSLIDGNLQGDATISISEIGYNRKANLELMSGKARCTIKK